MRLQQLSITTLAFVFLFVTVSAKGQQTEANSTAESTANSEIRDKAFNLLESLASQLSMLQSPENRARLGANIADSLWTHNEQRARLLFRAVGDDIRLGLQFRDSDDPRDEQTQLVFLKLRLDTAERIAKRDPELAMQFLTTTEPVFSKPPPRNILEQSQKFELHLATQLAASNPEIALKLGRQSLSKGLSHELFNLLQQLLRKHRQQGLTLYKEIIIKIRSTDLMSDWNNLNFATSLAQYLLPPDVDQQLFRELMDALRSTAQVNKCSNADEERENPYLCHQLESIVRYMEQVDSNPAARSRPRQNSPYYGYGPNGDVFEELEKVIAERDFDKVLALIKKYPDGEEMIYSRAFALAEQLDDLELATKLASEFEGDLQIREQMQMRLKRRADLAAFGELQLAETQRKLLEMKSPWERVDYLLELAVSIKSYNRPAALKLVNQANAITETATPGYQRIERLLIVAVAYSIIKNDRSFAIMESLMPRLNELVDAAAKLDGVETNYLRDGEWNMSAEGKMGSLLTLLARFAPFFAWNDFDRAVNLSTQFERTEIRMMAQVKLAQGIITGPPKLPR